MDPLSKVASKLTEAVASAAGFQASSYDNFHIFSAWEIEDARFKGVWKFRVVENALSIRYYPEGDKEALLVFHVSWDGRKYDCRSETGIGDVRVRQVADVVLNALLDQSMPEEIRDMLDSTMGMIRPELMETEINYHLEDHHEEAVEISDSDIEIEDRVTVYINASTAPVQYHSKKMS